MVGQSGSTHEITHIRHSVAIKSAQFVSGRPAWVKHVGYLTPIGSLHILQLPADTGFLLGIWSLKTFGGLFLTDLDFCVTAYSFAVMSTKFRVAAYV